MHWYFVFLPSLIGGIVVGWYLRGGYISLHMAEKLDAILRRSGLRWDSREQKIVKRRRNSDQTVM